MSAIDAAIRESREREERALEPYKHRPDARAHIGNSMEYRFRDALEVAVKYLIQLKGAAYGVDMVEEEIEKILEGGEHG